MSIVIGGFVLALLSFACGVAWILQKQDETKTATFYVTKSCKLGVVVSLGSGALKSTIDVMINDSKSAQIANSILDRSTIETGQPSTP